MWSDHAQCIYREFSKHFPLIDIMNVGKLVPTKMGTTFSTLNVSLDRK